eukprot:GHVO01034924.1.p1 GENE.GHVO01034924.1~~GHVO01034924.1.p1  ORF type:complete len:105 (+),score=16.36 GHVO01034924.1:250-564(+)
MKKIQNQAEELPFLSPQSLMSTRSCDQLLSTHIYQGKGSFEAFLVTVIISSPSSNVAMSLCGGLKKHSDISADKFDQFLVTYDQFCEDPAVLNNPDLVIKIGDK